MCKACDAEGNGKPIISISCDTGFFCTICGENTKTLLLVEKPLGIKWSPEMGVYQHHYRIEEIQCKCGNVMNEGTLPCQHQSLDLINAAIGNYKATIVGKYKNKLMFFYNNYIKNLFK